MHSSDITLRTFEAILSAHLVSRQVPERANTIVDLMILASNPTSSMGGASSPLQQNTIKFYWDMICTYERYMEHCPADRSTVYTICSLILVCQDLICTFS